MPLSLKSPAGGNLSLEAPATASNYTLTTPDATAVAAYGDAPTGALILPSGTTAQRSGSPSAGNTRFNSTLGIIEIYNGIDWQDITKKLPSKYRLNRSLRFRSSASAYLNRTYVASPTDYRKYTISAWVKLGALGVSRRLIDAGFGSDTGLLNFNADGTLEFAIVVSGSGTTYLKTNTLLRDPSAWYHIVFSCDTSVGSNQFKFYVNNVQASYSTNTAITTNYGTYLNSASAVGQLGRSLTYNQYFDGYLAEVNFIDGQALDPSYFGEYDVFSEVWIPKTYTGTYGTNGFYLKFEDNSAATAAAIGKDSSGNGNNWTPNNISLTAGVTYDSMTDVPTLTSATAANFCTLNPVYVSNIKAAPTLSNANLTTNAFYDTYMNGTIGLPRSGKFYWEATVTAATTGGNQTALGVNTNQGNNRTQHNFASVLNDVWGVAVDMDSLTVDWYKNNVWDTMKLMISGLEYFPFFYGDTNLSPTHRWSVNFGQRPFTYTPPTGFIALNTFNLPDNTNF
jgi:hypothetical protein